MASIKTRSNVKNIGVKYGLICGLVVVIAQLVGILLGTQTMGPGIGILSWFIVFAITFYIIYRGCMEYRDIHGNITTGEGLKIGVTCGLIAGLLGGIFSLLYGEIIDPEFSERLLETLREQWEEQGMSEEQIEQSMSFTERFTNPALSIPFTIIWYVIGGLIKGPIAGAILHRSE